MAWSILRKLVRRPLRVAAIVALLVPHTGLAATPAAGSSLQQHFAVRAQVLPAPILVTAEPTATGLPADEGLPPLSPEPSPTLHSAAVMFVENQGQVAGGADPSGQAAAPRFQVHGLGNAVYLAPDAIWITQLDLPAAGETPPQLPLTPTASATVVPSATLELSPTWEPSATAGEPTEMPLATATTEPSATATADGNLPATSAGPEPIATEPNISGPLPGDTLTVTLGSPASAVPSASSPVPASETVLPDASPTMVPASGTPEPSATSTAGPTLTNPTATPTPPPTVEATATAFPLPGNPSRPIGSNHLRITFGDANPAPVLSGTDRLDSRVSYFEGSDPNRWHADVPVWGGVRYTALYPGLDLEISSDHGQWTWRLVVIDPVLGLPQLANVRWQVDGADRLTLEPAGLRLHSPAGETVLPLLRVVRPNGVELSTAELAAAGATGPRQQANVIAQPFLALAQAAQTGARAPGLMAVIPNGAGQPVTRNQAQPLLDPNPPSQVYGSFLGGQALAVTADENGVAYVTGWTWSADFTYTVGYDQNQHAGTDLYVIKFSADGGSLHYLTHLGGDNDEAALAVAVDAAGAAYVTGYSVSSDYPTTANAYDDDPSGGGVIISKLSADGTELLYSTFLSHNGVGQGIAVQPWVNDVVYVTGYTDDNDYPTTGDALATSRMGDLDGFLAKLDTAQSGASSLVYSTFVGGNSQDCVADPGRACSVAVDRFGYVYVAGRSYSTDILTTGSAFTSTNAGGADAFLLKLDVTLSGTAGLLYGTYFGGSNNECEFGCYIAVNGNQRAYVTGGTPSTDLITTTLAYRPTNGGDYDAFVIQIDTLQSGLASLVYSTYLGGALGDVTASIAVNAIGEATLVGSTFSTDFPTTADAFDLTQSGDPRDTFLARLSADGSQLLYSTFVGGSGDDLGWGVAVQPHNDAVAFVVGWNQSSGDAPVTGGAVYNSWFPGADGLLTKFSIVTCAR